MDEKDVFKYALFMALGEIFVLLLMLACVIGFVYISMALYPLIGIYWTIALFLAAAVVIFALGWSTINRIDNKKQEDG